MELFLEKDIELWLMDIKKALELYLVNNTNFTLFNESLGDST